MTDTVIRENQKMRQLGGGLLIMIGLPLTLLVFLFGLSAIDSISDILILLPGPGLLAVGLWAAFPRHPPKIKMTISDEAVSMTSPQASIALDDLQHIRRHIPLLAKHTRLTFKTDEGDTPFDVIHLTHESQDIVNQISIRLEKRGKYLIEGRTDVRGAPNGIWEVREGAAFETDLNHAKNMHGR
ncbi:hypothetical protein QTO30_18305 [Yoonia sp. GPGPB17]|uniref:hypothetical protein n=1 Tax=Yoonia sp. GPGPB17 TaxID=3026147 RepID=UPI0030BE0ED5